MKTTTEKMNRMKNIENMENRPVKHPINKWLTRSNTIQNKLKLMDAEILMRKKFVQNWIDTNDFESAADDLRNLADMVQEYHKLFERAYGMR